MTLFTPISNLKGITVSLSILVSFGTVDTPLVVSIAGEMTDAVDVIYVKNSEVALRLETDDTTH